MNEPTSSTDADPDATEDSLRRLATDTDAGITTIPPVSPAEESEAAGPPADDAAPSPEEDTAPATPPPDPEPDNDNTAAVELARLREDLARQKAEVARLTQLTSLQGGSGNGARPAAPKRFADLSEREMAAEITRMAADIDGF